MVWAMRMSMGIWKTSLYMPGIAVSVGISLVLCLGWLAGCAPASNVQMAPPSNHELSREQEQRMSAVLVEAAEATPPSGQPLALLPANGIRWSDVPLAMDKASEAVHMAVLRHEDLNDDEVRYDLTSVQGWPATVTVRRLAEAPWVDATVTAGPWPGEDPSETRCRALRSSFLSWMRKFGAMKRVQPLRSGNG